MIQAVVEGIKGAIYWGGAYVVWLIVKVLFRLRVLGRENIPQDRGFIIAARHHSFWDIPLLIAALGQRHRVHFVARRSLLREWAYLPVWPFIALYSILIDREHFRGSDFKRVLGSLRQGKILGIFPEGTTKRLGTLRTGLVRFAELVGCDILPVRLQSVGPYPPVYPWRWGRVTLIIGPPFGLRDLEFDLTGREARRERYEKLTALLMARVDRVGHSPPTGWPSGG